MKHSWQVKIHRVLAPVLSIVLLTSSASAAILDLEPCTQENLDSQELCECANQEQLENDDIKCVPEPISLPLYCSDDDNATLKLGLNENFDLEFNATLNRKSPSKKLDMYALNGNTSQDGSNEIKVTTIKCVYDSNSKQSTCAGELTTEKEEKLAEKFNFDQAVIDLVFRKGKNNFCIGKLTNNEQLLAQNGLETRAFCTVRNLEHPKATEVEGFGFFDPRGYDDGAHLHLSVQGLPENKSLQACIPSGKSFTSAFSFRAYGATETDASIYGDLNEEESAKLSSEATAYSYDLWREVIGSADTSALFGKSLSQINRQVSPPSASSGRSSAKSSLSKRLKNSRSNKKRKRNKNKKKRAATSSVTASANNKKSSIFEWLSFDPIGGDTIYLASACNKKTANKAYASVSCSKDPAAIDGAECATINSADTTTAKVCRTSNSLVPMTIRVTGLTIGSYYVCTNGQALDKSLSINATEDSTYGELNVTDNAIISAAIDSYAVSKVALSEIATVTISPNEDCSEAVVSGEF